MLGCTVEGVAAESVGDILQSKLIKLTQEHQQALQQVGINVYTHRVMALAMCLFCRLVASDLSLT